MTITRGNSLPSLRLSNAGKPDKKFKISTVKKSVRFAKLNSRDLSLHVKYVKPISNHDKKNVHSSQSEKQEMRDNAYDVARNENKISNLKDSNPLSYSSLVTKAYECCCCDEYKKSDEEKLPQDEHEKLMEYLSESHADIRGMETFILKPSFKRKYLRLRRNSVRDLIEKHAIEMANKGYLSSAAEASILNKYRRSSRAAQKFARYLAQLDQEAVERERHTDRQLHKELFRVSSPRTIMEESLSIM